MFMDLLIYVRKVYKPQHPALCWLLADPPARVGLRADTQFRADTVLSPTY